MVTACWSHGLARYQYPHRGAGVTRLRDAWADQQGSEPLTSECGNAFRIWQERLTFWYMWT